MTQTRYYLLVLHGGLELQADGSYRSHKQLEQAICQEMHRNVDLLADDGLDTAHGLSVTMLPGAEPAVKVWNYSGTYMNRRRRRARRQQRGKKVRPCP